MEAFSCDTTRLLVLPPEQEQVLSPSLQLPRDEEDRGFGASASLASPLPSTAAPSPTSTTPGDLVLPTSTERGSSLPPVPHAQRRHRLRTMLSFHAQRLGRGDSASAADTTRSGAGAERSWEGDSVPSPSLSAPKRSLRSVKSLIFDSHSHAYAYARGHGTSTSKSQSKSSLDSDSMPKIPRPRPRGRILSASPLNFKRSHSRFAAAASSRLSESSSPSPPSPASSATGRMPLSVSVSGFGSSSMRSKSTESDCDWFVSIRPRISGVFTPSSLPPELWLLILRYATCPPFIPLPGTPLPLSFSSSSSTPFSSLSSPASAPASASGPPSEPVSFLTHAPPHTHFAERLAEYNAHLKWKAALTRVCRVWNWVAQEILYEVVWIARGREGRALAGRLCGDVGGVGGADVCVSAGGEGKENDTKKKGKEIKGLGWFKKKDHPSLSATSSSSSSSKAHRPPPSRRPSFGDSSSSPSNVGRFIKRLHIETPSMEKCSPHDLLIILQYAPLLEVFEDYRSVRRPMHPLVVGGSDVLPFSSSSSSSSSSFGSSPASSLENNDVHAGGGSYVQHSQHHQHHHKHHHHQQDLLAPDALLHTLLSRPLKKLSWTNYDYDPSDFELGVRFYEDVVGPRLMGLGGGSDKLEFLEISLSGGGVGMGGGFRGAGGGSTAWGINGNGNRNGSNSNGTIDEEDVRRRARMRASSRRVGGSRAAAWVDNPQAGPLSGMGVGVGGFGAASLLTELRADYTTTTTTTTYTSSSSSVPLAPSPSSSSSSSSSFSGVDTPHTPTLILPNLRSLKATLDNATFFVLSTWDMPLLSHLSVMSADFAYAGSGFRRFFEVHGAKIVQLELGHSSGEVEEAWVTQPPPPPPAQVNANANASANLGLNLGLNGATMSPADQPFSVPLNEWCPNLKEFICSADAEWNWQSPDWIAPHVLLPTHPGLQFIGVRDMERRLVGDADDAARRRRENQGLQMQQVNANANAQANANANANAQGWEEDPYFMLLEQFGSLLRKEAFPSLLFVRDMSWESDRIRRTGRMRMPCGSVGGGGGAMSAPASESIPRWLPTPVSPYVGALLHTGGGGGFWSAASSQPSSSSSSSTSLSLFSGFSSSSARRFIARASPLSLSSSTSSSSSLSYGATSPWSSSSSSSPSSSSSAQAEEAQAHAQGLQVLRFWERVLERCRERGVWLEDWRGVNVTLGDLRRAACS